MANTFTSSYRIVLDDKITKKLAIITKRITQLGKQNSKIFQQNTKDANKMATAFSRIKMPKVPSMGGVGGGVVNTAKHRQVLSLQQKITNEFRKQNKQVAKLNRGFSTMIDKGKAGMFRVTAPIVGVGALALKTFADISKKSAPLMQAFKFEGMSDSGAADMIRQLEDFARTTPFSPIEVFQKAGFMKALGVETKDLMSTMKMLGDLTASTGGDFGRLALAYTQILSKGKLMAQEANQLAETNIGIRQILADHLKVSQQEVRDMAEAGNISAELVTTVLKKITSEGGRYAGGMTKLMENFGGSIMFMQSSFTLMMKQLGQKISETFGLTKKFTAMANTFTKIGQKIKEMDGGTAKLVFGMITFTALLPPALITIGLIGKGLTMGVATLRGMAGALAIVNTRLGITNLLTMSVYKNLARSVALFAVFNFQLAKTLGFTGVLSGAFSGIGRVFMGIVSKLKIGLSILLRFSGIASLIYVGFKFIQGIVRGIASGLQMNNDKTEKQYGLVSLLLDSVKLLGKAFEFVGWVIGKFIVKPINWVINSIAKLLGFINKMSGGMLGKIGENLKQAGEGFENTMQGTKSNLQFQNTEEYKNFLKTGEGKKMTIDVNINNKVHTDDKTKAQSTVDMNYSGKGIEIKHIANRTSYMQGAQLLNN